MTSIVILALGATLIVGFVLVEQRVPDPILPLWAFSRRILVTSSLASAGVGAIVLGLTSYIPTFVQDVIGTGAVVAGFALAALTLGWPITASQSGRIYLRVGFRNCALIGMGLTILGSALLLLVGEHSGVPQVAATCFVIGMGMGLVATPTLIAAQATVGWGERGVVTGTNMFCRALGSALGVAIFGAIANSTLGSSVGPRTVEEITVATHHVFIGVFVVALATAVAVAAMPRTRSAVPAPASVRSA